MSKSAMRVRVHGAQLREDRENANLTREKMISAIQELGFNPPHAGTLLRAENCARIDRKILMMFAQLLGKPVERYIVTEPDDIDAPPSVNLTGDWLALFVVDDGNEAPFIAEQAIFLEQKGSQLEGGVTAQHKGVDRSEVFEDCHVYRDMFMGKIYAEEWKPPLGYGLIQMTCSRVDDWLDGFCLFSDPDSRIVLCYKCLAIRTDCAWFDTYLEEAREVMKRELQIYNQRAKFHAEGCTS